MKVIRLKISKLFGTQNPDININSDIKIVFGKWNWKDNNLEGAQRSFK